MEVTIRNGDVKFTKTPFEKIIKVILSKYNIEAVNDNMVKLSGYDINIDIIMLVPKKIVSVSGTMNILRNEIYEKIYYFSGIKPKRIQIILGTKED